MTFYYDYSFAIFHDSLLWSSTAHLSPMMWLGSIFELLLDCDADDDEEMIEQGNQQVQFAAAVILPSLLPQCFPTASAINVDGAVVRCSPFRGKFSAHSCRSSNVLRVFSTSDCSCCSVPYFSPSTFSNPVLYDIYISRLG